MNNKFFKNKNQGFSIIEVMVAMGVILMSFTAMITLINKSLAFHDLAYSRLTAAYLAQEGIEIVRNIRDNNILANRAWNDGLNNNGYYEVQYSDLALRSYSGQPLKLTSDGIYQYDEGAITRYTRTIQIENNVNHIKVQSIVSWRNRGGEFNIVVEDHLYNWLGN